MKARIAFSLPRRRLLGALVAPLVVSRAAAAQSGGQAVRTRSASTPRFRINIPEKDWRLLPGGICTHGCLAHKDNAVAIVIEHELMQIALSSDEIDRNFGELELAAIREREPSVSQFAARIEQVGTRRSVIVDYRRGAGGAEQVRVFVLLHGRHLYRLVCVAPSGQFARYEPTFQTVCGSFAPSDAGPTP
jgi:hypothetical protein